MSIVSEIGGVGKSMSSISRSHQLSALIFLKDGEKEPGVFVDNDLPLSEDSSSA